MKITITSPLATLDRRITSFASLPIDEFDYTTYKEQSEDGEYLITNRWILRLEKKVLKQDTVYLVLPICTYVKIKYCQQDIITNGRTYCVELFNGGNYSEVILESDVLTAQGVKLLLAHGCLYDENNIRYLLKYLSNSAFHAPIRNVHSRLGWLWNGTEPIFLQSKAISRSDFQSSYIGQIDMEPKGSLDAWLEMVKAEVIGNTAAEICLLIGFASVILGYLNHFTDLGCLLFNFCNTSSKGKTTMAMLSASVWGNPSLDKGLVTTLNSTPNALVAFVAQGDSHTIIFDESGTGDRGNFRKTVYQLATGRDRMRLNTDGSMKESACFNSCIVLTSEFPIVDTTAPSGIRTRVFEIFDNLTTSAENADHIKRVCYHHYGHAGIEFVRFIMQNKLDMILNDYDKCKKTLAECSDKVGMTPGELTERVFSKLAILLLTAKYANQCFALDIDLLAIVKFLLNLENSIKGEADIASKALDLILQYVSLHNNHFLYDNDTGQFHSGSIEGKIKSYNGYKELIILKVVVDQLLFDNGYENPRAIYGKLSEKKLLIPASDRPEKKRRLIKNLPGQPCLTFRIPEEI